MTPLTPDQETLLRKPFQVYEHGYVNGRPYLKKDAIRRRLSKVDPGWQTLPPAVLSLADDVVVLTGGIEVAGVSRYDLGTGIIQRTARDGKELPDYDVSRNVAKAFKTASSDLIPRCAVQFGVGEYLKAVPKEVRDERSLRDWLVSLSPAASKPAEHSQNGELPPASRSGQSSGPPPRTPLTTAPPRR